MIAAVAIPASHPTVTSPVGIFSVVMLLILLAPVLLNKLKIPHVIGLILAGVIVGPYGFNILARDMSFEVFGQVGLLYLMFLAGIEIDMYHLKRNLRKGAVFGAFTFITPVALGTAAALVFMDLGWVAALMMGSIFGAHTLIAYPIVSRLGLTKSSSVVIAVAGTIFTVLGSLVVLAVANSAASSQADSTLLLRLLAGLLAFCLFVLYVYPRLTRWFFKHYNEGVLQFVYVLAMVFLAAVIAQWIGIEGVFGAFFAGLVLNRYIPARTPLMSRLEFVGNALFIPYFLIGVGMLINVRVLTEGLNTIYIAAIMSAVAMFGKWLAAFFTQKLYHMTSLDRSMMFQLSNAHTAVALAAVMIGFESGLFDEAILNGTIIMILVTCTVSSVGVARAAKRMKVEELGSTITDTGPHKDPTPNTLVAVDNPQTAVELVNLALMTHTGSRQSSEMYALHVRSDNSAISRSLSRASLDVSEKIAASVDARLKTIERYDINFVTGMLNTIEERDVGEVVIGLHRRSTVIDSFFGDKLSQLLKATNRMVMISRCYIPVNTLTRIVVTVPAKSEFETGFRRWVKALGNLSLQLGCRIIFCCNSNTRRCIASVLRAHNYEIRSEFCEMDGWDDFILLANKILDDDLFVVINARRTSVSFNADMDSLPEFLRRHFSQNNLLVIFPEQFGETDTIMADTMAETLSTDIVAAPSPLWLHIMSVYRKGIAFRKRFTHRNRKPKIDL